jgi:hypothetical protein
MEHGAMKGTGKTTQRQSVEPADLATSNSIVQRERQGVADSGSSDSVEHSLCVDANGDDFRGDDALFQAMLNGANVRCAAAMSGLSERTVFRRLADPVFNQRLEKARENVRGSILARLNDAADAAVDTLWHLLDNEEPSIQLSAARSLLDALVKVQNASPRETTKVRYSVEQTQEM